MEKEGWGEGDAFEAERMGELKEKDHKILSLFEIIKEGEEHVRHIQEEQSEESEFSASMKEINCPFLLAILKTLGETVHDSMVTSWDSEIRIEILPEIFFYQTSQQQIPTLQRVLENLARLFREEGSTATSVQQTDIDSSLTIYKHSRMDQVGASQKKDRKRGKPLTEEQNKELVLVQEKFELLSEIVKNLNNHRLLPQSVGKISLPDLFFILADLIEEQTEILNEM